MKVRTGGLGNMFVSSGHWPGRGRAGVVVVVVQLYNWTVRQTTVGPVLPVVLLSCQYNIQPSTPYTTPTLQWTVITADITVWFKSVRVSFLPMERSSVQWKWQTGDPVASLVPPPAVFYWTWDMRQQSGQTPPLPTNKKNLIKNILILSVCLYLIVVAF